MRKIAKLLPTILSVLMVSTSLSVSACDLSCLLNQTSPDCHSASLAAEDGLTVPSAMEMSAGIQRCAKPEAPLRRSDWRYALHHVCADGDAKWRIEITNWTVATRVPIWSDRIHSGDAVFGTTAKCSKINAASIVGASSAATNGL